MGQCESDLLPEPKQDEVATNGTDDSTREHSFD